MSKLVFYCPRETCENHRGVAWQLADWEAMAAEFELMGLEMDGTYCYCGEWMAVSQAETVGDDWQPEPEEEVTDPEPPAEPEPEVPTEPEEPDPWDSP